MISLEMKKELKEHIIPFWNRLKDEENGGFYGFVSAENEMDKKAEKGVILHARILWFYSNCFLILKDEESLRYAQHAYEFLTKACWDKENQGFYWMMTYDGKVKDGQKHAYCQAFCIYALSSYYLASKNEDALSLAKTAYDILETRCYDEPGYLESFNKRWELMDNDHLSENGLMAVKTMNTTLHILEAYTELYKASPGEALKTKINSLLRFFLSHIYDKEKDALLVFFDKDMKVMGDIHSYGHDIEATWLLDRACDVAGDEDVKKEISAMNKRLVKNLMNIAFDGTALRNERDKEHIDSTRVWWVQGEGVVGFYNAYQRFQDPAYLKIANSLWDYIKTHGIDKASGEWFSKLTPQEIPLVLPLADPWKCPYHNGRMCLEIVERSLTEKDSCHD